MTEYAHYFNVELRDKAGDLKQYLTPYITDLSWEWNRIGGCGRARIKLNLPYRKIEFGARDDIQIRMRDGSTTKLVYRGWVSGVIPSLKVPQDITLDVRGYFDLLDLVVVHNAGLKKTYVNYLLSDIVEDIIDTFVTPSTPITKGTIDGATFTADSLQFKAKVSEALKTLAETEGEIEYGVDENLVFFWRKESTALRHKFIVGNDVEVFERRIAWDPGKFANKIVFEGGEVAGVVYTKIAEATDSQSQYFIAELIVNNSSITTSAVADQYLSALLKEKSVPLLTLRAKIANIDLRLEDTVPLGEIAIYDPDYDESTYIFGEVGDGGSDLIFGLLADGGSNAIWGGVYKGQIEKIQYTPSETEENVNIEITLGGSLLETSAKIKQLDLLINDLRQR